MKTDLPSLLNSARHRLALASGARQLHNRLRFGANAPRQNMRLVIHPDQITQRLHVADRRSKPNGNRYTGMVLGGDWDLSKRAFDKSLKHRACRAHFIKGLSWADTPAIRYGLGRIAQDGLYDGCRTRADLDARYANLDTLWRIVQQSGQLPAEVAAKTNARTGILVHLARDGELLFGNQGFHRLSIAKLAKLEQITVVLGAVHPGAIQNGAFKACLAAHSP